MKVLGLVIVSSLTISTALTAQTASRSGTSTGGAKGSSTGTTIAPVSGASGAAAARAAAGTSLIPSATNAGQAELNSTGSYTEGNGDVGGLRGVAEINESELSAADKAALQVELGSSSEALNQLNDAHAQAVAAATVSNEPAEAQLNSFVNEKVPSWKCGDACVTNVANMLNEGTEKANEAVMAGKDVTVADVVVSGLAANGLLEQAGTECKAELGQLMAIGSTL